MLPRPLQAFPVSLPLSVGGTGRRLEARRMWEGWVLDGLCLPCGASLAVTVAIRWFQFPPDKAAVVPLSTHEPSSWAPVIPLFPFVPPAWEGGSFLLLAYLWVALPFCLLLGFSALPLPLLPISGIKTPLVEVLRMVFFFLVGLWLINSLKKEINKKRKKINRKTQKSRGEEKGQDVS